MKEEVEFKYIQAFRNNDSIIKAKNNNARIPFPEAYREAIAYTLLKNKEVTLIENGDELTQYNGRKFVPFEILNAVL